MIKLFKTFFIIGTTVFHFTFPFVTSNILQGNITSCAMDQTAGIFYAAVEEIVGQPGIVKANMVTGSQSPQFAALNSYVVGKGYKYITMICDYTSTIPSTIAAVTHSDNGLFNKIIVSNDSVYTITDVIEDANYNDDTYGLSPQYASYVYPNSINDSEILSIVGSSNVIFSVVHRVHNDFLAPGSALNVHKLTLASNAITIDPTYVQKRLDSRDFLVGTEVNKVSNVADAVILCYNSELKTLYCAPHWITSANNDVCGVRSVAAYKFNLSDYSLSSLPLHQTANTASTTSWYVGSTPSTQNILGVMGALKTLSVHHMAVMHTSTNKYYLIIYGGHGFSYQTGDQVYALPLVGPAFTEAGMLANTNDANFATAAQNAAQLYTAASAPAQIGGGVLPWEAANYLNHMVVMNDTVYVSVHNPSATKSGIYYSQAKFNDKGNIVKWTPWELAAPRSLGAQEDDGSIQGAVKTFAVNKISGKVWAIPSDNLDRVRVPSWIQLTRKKRGEIIHRMITRAGLDEQLSPTEALYDTLRSIFVTASWQVENDAGERVTFSGYVGKGIIGRQKIVIIRKTVEDLVKNTSNFKIIDSPTTEPILSIGFLQSPIDVDYPTGILLIGTQTKLYAYLHTTTCQGGYVNNVEELNVNADTDDLSQGYWSTGKWYQILPSVFNANIVSIDALYGDLYILQRAKDFNKNDILYRIDRGDIASHTLCNVTPKIMWEVDRNSPQLPYLLNHIVLPAQDDNTLEHIMVGSYNGAFMLTVPGGVQNATTQDQVTVTPVVGTENQKIVALERTSDNESRIIGQTVQNKVEEKTIYVAPQASGEVTTAVITSETLTPTTVNTMTPTTAGTPAIVSNGSSVWTDGARKFTITSNTLLSQEGNTAEKKISTCENEAFNGKQLYSIDNIGGVITIQTQDKALYLK